MEHRMSEISQYEKLKNLTIESLDMKDIVAKEKTETDQYRKNFLHHQLYVIDVEMVLLVGEIYKYLDLWHEFGEWQSHLQMSFSEISIVNRNIEKFGVKLLWEAIMRFNSFPRKVRREFWEGKPAKETIRILENCLNGIEPSKSDIEID